MPEEQLQERTEEPTPRRREEARKRGQVARSREVAAVAILGGGLLSFLVAGTFMLSQLFYALQFFLQNPFATLGAGEAYLTFKYALKFGLRALFPFLIFLTLVALLSHFLQTGGVAAWEFISPKAERIHPVEGFKRLFSLPSLVELLKSILKIVIISTVAYLVIRKHQPGILSLMGEDLWAIARGMYLLARDLAFKLLMALTALAIFDYFFQRWEVERKLKMTREELKEELKQTEGDPWVKARVRQIQREMARKRMMAEVPKADVVITNPEHVAVALKYDMGKMPAPKVVAKGQGALAQKIKEIARESGVPIVEDPPLARLLYARVEVDEYIPEDLYKAVAEVLAYVYKLKNRKMH